jgi:hypothetical protein
LGKLATSGYQEKKLEQDLKNAQPHVARVLEALACVVSIDYKGSLPDSKLNLKCGVSTQDNWGVLKIEKNGLLARNKTYLEVWDKESGLIPGDPTIRVLFRDQWEARSRSIDAKDTAADAYIQALATIRDGDNKLADQASQSGGLKGTKLLQLLQPYTDDISQLVPLLQKVL